MGSLAGQSTFSITRCGLLLPMITPTTPCRGTEWEARGATWRTWWGTRWWRPWARTQSTCLEAWEWSHLGPGRSQDQAPPGSTLPGDLVSWCRTSPLSTPALSRRRQRCTNLPGPSLWTADRLLPSPGDRSSPAWRRKTAQESSHLHRPSTPARKSGPPLPPPKPPLHRPPHLLQCSAGPVYYNPYQERSHSAQKGCSHEGTS